MRLLAFYLLMGALFIFLMFADSGQEGSLPIFAFLAAIAAVVALSLLDIWRHPEIYRKRKKQTQRTLF
jgi:membrane protein implicated in regulation of membrane protease activity